MTTKHGNVMAIACDREDGHLPGHPRDMTMRDVRHVVDYLQLESSCVCDVHRFPWPSTPAVKINCIGDKARLGISSDLEVVRVPTVNPIPDTATQWPSACAFLLGLPWVCRPTHDYRFYELDARRPVLTLEGWLQTKEAEEATNPRADFIQIRAVYCSRGNFTLEPPKDKSFKFVFPREVLMRTYATVLTINFRGTPLHLAHIVVFNQFCALACPLRALMRRRHPREGRELDRLVFEKFGDAEAVCKRKGKRLPHFNREDFERYWLERKRLNDVPGLDLGNIPSPYDDSPSLEGCGTPLAEREVLEKILIYMQRFLKYPEREPL